MFDNETGYAVVDLYAVPAEIRKHDRLFIGSHRCSGTQATRNNVPASKTAKCQALSL
jgi:hypothetical protein